MKLDSRLEAVQQSRRANFLGDCTREQTMAVRYTKTDRQPADILTKPLERASFEKLRDYLLNLKAQVVHTRGKSSE